MAEKRATVEVRLLGKRTQTVTGPDGASVLRAPGDVFQIDRALYEADLEPDRGMGRPARGRTFAPVAEERAVKEKQTQTAQATQDRIGAVRGGVRDQMKALEVSRAQSKVQEADNARALADALTAKDQDAEGQRTVTEVVTKPLERPGARRV